MKRRLILIGFLILLVGVGGLVYYGRQKRRTAERFYSGTLEASTQADIGFQVSGRVREVLVDEGDVIEKNQLLAVLEQEEFLTRREQARAHLKEAEETLKRALELSTHCGAKYYMGWALRLLGSLFLITDPGHAAPYYERAISVAQEIKAENDLALAYSGMGRYHKLQGNTEQAREYLTEALEIFERLGTLIEPDKVRRELVELPQ